MTLRLFIIASFILLSFNAYAQGVLGTTSSSPFSVTLDSPELVKREDGVDILKLKVHITNNSTKSFKLQDPHPYPYLGYGGWKLIITKDYERCRWDSERHFITVYGIKDFKLKPGKTISKELSCDLEGMTIGGKEYTPGEYNVRLELLSIDGHKVLQKPVDSNVISFIII